MSYDVDSLIKKFTLYGNTNQVASPMKSHNQYENEISGNRYYQEQAVTKRPSDFVTRLNDNPLYIRNIMSQQAPFSSFEQSNLSNTRKTTGTNHQLNGSSTQLSYKANSFQMSQNKTNSTSRNGLNENSNFHYNPIYNTFHEHTDLRDDLITAPPSARNMNNLNENEKSKFFNTLKSLFAIFDPECKGSIDLNELEKLGSNKNEILNEVVEYLRKRNECFSPGANRKMSMPNTMDLLNNQSAEHSSYRIVNSNSNGRFNDPERPKFYVSQQSPQFQSNSHRSLTQSDFASSNSFVTFDEFVKAAELILDKRKQSKIQNQKNHKTKSNEPNSDDLSETTNSNNEDVSYYSNSASSSSSSPSSSSSSNRKSNTQSSQSHQYNQPTSNDDLSDGDRDNEPLGKLVDKTNFMVKSPTKNASKTTAFNGYNSYQSPSAKSKQITVLGNTKVASHAKMNSMTTSTLSSASSNLLASTTASATSSSSSIDITSTTHTKTLSQAFDDSAVFGTDGMDNRSTSKSRRPHVSLSGVATISPSKGGNLNSRSVKSEADVQNRVIKVSTNFNLSNANSCDLSGLIDKENYLLKEGLNDLEAVKVYYLNQLKENQQKQNNIARLKHQNLFSIDKMLLDLKQLNDFNLLVKDFMVKNAKPDMELQSGPQSLASTKPARTEPAKSVHFSTNQQSQNLPPPPQMPPPPPIPPQQPMASQDVKQKPPFVTNVQSSGPNSSSGSSLPKYKEYIEQLDLYKNETDLDKYLKEKQERIDALQKEKSMLIRKLFEMKSSSASLQDKSQQQHTFDQTNETLNGKSSLATSSETPTSPLFNTTICQLIETPKANSQRNYENLSYRSPPSHSQHQSTTAREITASYRTPTASLSQYNQHHKPMYPQSAQLSTKQPHHKQLKFNNCDQTIINQSNRNFSNQKFI